MLERNRQFIFIAAVAIVAAGCEHSRPLGIVETQPTLSNIQSGIFTPRCAVSGCHVPGGAGPMPLRNEQESFLSLVNKPSTQLTSLSLVKPGDPANSYLLLKLDGDSRIMGARMPLGGNALSSSEIGIIEQWISGISPNN